MRSQPRTAPIGLLLSGGLDSSILLGHLLGQGHRVQPFYIRTDLRWHREELRAVGRFMEAMADPALESLVTLELPLRDVYGDHWSVTGRAVPDASTSDDAVYLPGRNALLVVKAAVRCGLHGIDQLALAVLSSNPFPDATAGFFRDFESVLSRATGARLRIVRPFGHLSKRQVMELGRRLPLELTYSCISPVKGMHCGACNKCAERQSAFRLIDMEDPTQYTHREPPADFSRSGTSATAALDDQ